MQNSKCDTNYDSDVAINDSMEETSLLLCITKDRGMDFEYSDGGHLRK